MISHALADRLLQLARLEHGPLVRHAPDGLVRFEDPPRHAHIEVHASIDVQPQATEHDRDQAARARACDQIEMLARSGDLPVTRRSPGDLDKRAMHDLLQHDQHGVPSDPSPIERKNAQRRAFGGVPPSRPLCFVHGDLLMRGARPQHSCFVQKRCRFRRDCMKKGLL